MEREITKGRVPRAFTRALGGAEGQRGPCGAESPLAQGLAVQQGRERGGGGGAATAKGCWAVSSALAIGPPSKTHPVSGRKVSHTRGGPRPVPPKLPDQSPPALPLRCWARREGRVPGPPAGPRRWPGLRPLLRTQGPTALTCGRPRLPSGRTGCAGCSVRRGTGGWRHRW